MIIINDIVNNNIVEQNQKNKIVREQNRFWPTECSCIVLDKVFGKCSRELYYSMTGEESTNPISARGLRICDAGNMYEDKEIERVKNIKYYKDSGYKFKFLIPETNITVAGKVDIIYNIDGNIIGGEIKSGYGYMFKSQVFDTSIPGLPVIKHLMQVLMYLYYFKYHDSSMGINEFYITYIDRGDCENTQFSIKLTQDDYPIIQSETLGIKIIKNVNLSNTYLFKPLSKNKIDNNKINKFYEKLKYYEISISNIFNRFKYISEFVNKKILPPKDYKYFYTAEEIEEKYKNGDIAKSKYDKIKKGVTLERDFQCMYCNYLKQCMTADGFCKFKN